MPRNPLARAIRRALPHVSVTNAYGTTEAGPVVFGPHPRDLPQPDMSVGYPHPKVELRLVDGSNRNATAARGESLTICIVPAIAGAVGNIWNVNVAL